MKAAGLLGGVMLFILLYLRKGKKIFKAAILNVFILTMVHMTPCIGKLLLVVKPQAKSPNPAV